MKKPKYQRILLKLSGEALSAGQDGILDFDFINVECHRVQAAGDFALLIRDEIGHADIEPLIENTATVEHAQTVIFGEFTVWIYPHDH